MNRFGVHTLRPYQLRAFESILAEFDRGLRSTYAKLATGTGKTHIQSICAKWGVEELGCRVLTIAHIGELMEQAAEKYEGYGIRSAIEKADQTAYGLDLTGDIRSVIGSVQTMKGERLRKWPRDHFGLIVVDECHHAVASTYRAIFDHFDAAKIVGVTATDERMDGKQLVPGVFRSRCFRYDMDEAVQDGYLVPPEVHQIPLRIDLRKLKAPKGKDFNKGDLEEVVSANMGPIVNAIKQEIDTLGIRQGIVFTPDAKSSLAMAKALCSIGVRARGITCESPDRREIIRGFKDGEYQLLCNYGIATEGFDHPPIEAVFLARPTKSIDLYRQMAGRGCRPYADGSGWTKEKFYLLDFAYITDQPLVSPIDLVATEATDDRVKDIARGIVRTGKVHDPKEALRKAQEIVERDDRLKAAEEERKRKAAEEKARREALKLHIKEKRLNYQKRIFDPLNVGRVMGIRVEQDARRERPTFDQLRRLKELGFVSTVGMDRQHADALIVECEQRDMAGMSSHKQAMYLVKRNACSMEQAYAMTKQEASRAIADLHRNAGAMG